MSGARLVASEPYSEEVTDVRPLPRAGPLAEFVLYARGEFIWAHLWVDGRHRLRREVIIAPGHRIERTFSYPPR